MAVEEYKSPLHKTVCIGDTDIWNDSCSAEELKYAIENGAVGATTNPVIVVNVLKKEMHIWEKRIEELVDELSNGTEEDIAWKLMEEMAVNGAEILKPVFEKEKELKGRISIQTNAKYYRNDKLMVEQAVHLHNLAPNMQIKIPATKSGIAAIEEAVYRGVNINATVCFTVPQAIAVAEAVEKGLDRRKAEGQEIETMRNVCTIMVGRLDDWLKSIADKADIIADPNCFEWAGVAAMKKSYGIYKKRGYRTRLLVAAYRNHLHWSEFIGGDVVLTIPYKWQKRYNTCDVEVKSRMDKPVDQGIIDELYDKFEDFRKAYDIDGMKEDEFDSYGASVRTLRSFIAGYEDLLRIIRNIMLPDLDKT